MEKRVFSPEGVCSSRIFFTLDGDRVVRVEFEDGCDGNLQGIARLVEGMPVEEVIRRLKGIDCNYRGTSEALLADTAERIAEARASRDGREGIDAFLSRRKPSWNPN